MVDSITSGLTVTMTTPATSTSFTIAPLNSIVHTLTQYNLAISFAVPHQIGDYFIMQIPPSMTFSATPTCVPISGIASIGCILLNLTAIKVNLNAVPTASAQISISNIRNYDVATSQSFQLFFYNSGDFDMEVTPTGSTTYTPTAISPPTVSNNDQIALYESSNITLTISTPFTMDSSFLVNQTSLTLIPPTGFSITSNTSCTASIGSCLVINGSFVVSGVGLSVNNLIVTIEQITLPYFSPTSTSFSITYGYAGSQVATINSGVTVSVYCSSPCERCVSSMTACASCLPSPNTALLLYTINSSCLTTCPNGYYNSTFLCVICSAPCLDCLDSTNCTKCTATTYLYGTACLTVCPPTFFGNSSNICESCVSPCGNCSSSTACLSCLSDYLYVNSCVAAASCPVGTFPDNATLTCAACPVGCTNCISLGNCSGCTPVYFFFNFTCLITCPNTTFLSTGNNCVPCSGCPTCQGSANNCTSCVSPLLLSANSCVSNCPSGTYSNGASCMSCSSVCV